LQGVNGEFQNKTEPTDLPIWARDDSFPPAPAGFGWIDRKGATHSCASLAEISEKIRKDSGNSILFVWTPDSEFCHLPEEIEPLSDPIHEVRKRWALEDFTAANQRLRWLGSLTTVFIAYISFQYILLLQRIEQANGVKLDFLEQVTWVIKQLIASTPVGISLLCFLIFGFIPWYQARKTHREMALYGYDPKAIRSVLRFETWLSLQKSPASKLILIAISIVFLAQIIGDQSLFGFDDSIHQAGLVKSAYAEGESWRLFTAPMLHGGLLHFAMNALALLYLGKRMEVFARWPHLPIVFLLSALMAGEASARFTALTSVGASGGLMGWLGFLLVFETLHHRLVPRNARRRLLAGVFLTALIGIIGYRFIDNAAHFGGLVAGVIYAAIVFPKSSSPLRPRMNLTDRFVGSVCLAVIFLSSVMATLKILS